MVTILTPERWQDRRFRADSRVDQGHSRWGSSGLEPTGDWRIRVPGAREKASFLGCDPECLTPTGDHLRPKLG